ncbi:MAG TPA: RNA polymerase sigma factor [Candidatus Limnocylindria bacterium]|nr:RNA polymerase sigma factor [Candidatus Limnocylindria bacterium]
MDTLDFEQLVAQYHEPLFRFAYSLAQTEVEARELTQQTFYLWAAKGHQLRDLSKVKTWLFTTLHREYLGGKRRQVRFPHFELEEVEVELPVQAPPGSYRLDGVTVREALAQIDELYRVPLALFYLEDYSYNEIAEILQVPLGTIKSRISRGMAMLQELFGADRTTAARKVANG